MVVFVEVDVFEVPFAVSVEVTGDPVFRLLLEVRA